YPVFQDARLQPFVDQADDALVTNPMLDEADEPFLVHRVEERSDVGIQYEVHLPALNAYYERIHRIVCVAPGPEPVREPEEVFLVDRVQDRRRRPLDDLVFESGYRQRSLPSVRLGNVYAPG